MIAPTVQNRLRYLALICASLSGLASLVGLVALHQNIWILATLGEEFTSLAPTAGYSFVLLNFALIIYCLWPDRTYSRRLIGIVTTLVLAACSLFLLQYLLNFDLRLERHAIPTAQRSRDMDFRMAPISAFTFILTEIAILLIVFRRENLLARNIAAILTSVTIIIGLIVIIGYGYRTPLLYGENTILPMAFIAAISFFFLGIAVLAVAGPDNWVVRQFLGESVKVLLRRAFLPLVLAIMIVQGWMGFYLVTRYHANPALSTAMLALFSLVVVGIIISYLSSRIGGQIDQKEIQRCEAEAALQESEEKFRILFESADDSILLIDRYRIIDCNGSTLKIFNCAQKDQIVGKTLHDFSPQWQPDGRISGDEITHSIISALSGHPQSFDWQHIRCDGTTFDADISLHSIELGEKTMLQAIIRDITERKQAEQEKRAFYRETILNATEGKLRISDEMDIKPFILAAQLTTDLNSVSEVGLVRRTAEHFLSEHGLVDDRLNDLLIAMSEATANVAKHAGSGHVYMGADDRSAWVAISDQGPGIGALILPKAVFKRGFSTKPSMGLGYSVILQLADHILLKTDKNGTDVVLVKYLHHVETNTIDSMPDTWEGITSL